MKGSATIAELGNLMERHPRELRRRVKAMQPADRARLADFAALLARLVDEAKPNPTASERADFLMTI